MKLIKSVFAIALVASAFAACQRIEDTQDFSTSKTVSFSANALETKTAFGEADGTSYPTLWTKNDQKVAVSLNFGSSKSAEITPSADYKTADFSVEIDDDESGDYTFYSVSPADAVVSISKDYQSWNVTIPSSQKPLATSVDESAQILVAATDPFTLFPAAVAMTYKHLTAYGKMTLKNLELGDAEITSIALTASENWSGRWYYYPETDEVSSQAGSSSTITLETDATEDIWFACAPVDLAGKTLKITVNTTNGPIVKEITFRDNAQFESGTINKFAVDMDGLGFEESKVYTLVTDLNDLTEDSEVIIAAADANYAMSTSQNTNNRGQASVTKSDDTITDPGDDVQILTLKKGSEDNTIAFSTGNGYLYAASSSSNWLRTQASIDANASFSAEMTDNGVVVLTAQGSNTRNWMLYNSGSSCFACYASTTSVSGPLSIYKLEGSGTDTPLIVVDNTEYTITVSDSENGSVTASAEKAKKGTEITLTITPAEGYMLNDLTVKDSDNNDVEVKEGKFTMPASNVTVSASFKTGRAVTFVAGTDTGDTSVTKDGITVSMSTMSRTDNYRTYANTDMTVSSSDYTITKIEITCTASGSAQYGPGSFSGEGYSFNGNNGVWEGSSSEVKLSASSQVRITEITVTYE